MRKRKYFNKFSTMIAVFLITFMAGGLWMNPEVAESNDAKGSHKNMVARFDFALIEDIPRIGDPALEPDLEAFIRLRDEINRTKGIRFVIHDGDYKTGGSECSVHRSGATGVVPQEWCHILNSATGVVHRSGVTS